jgi:hypothetical protein
MKGRPATRRRAAQPSTPAPRTGYVAMHACTHVRGTGARTPQRFADGPTLDERAGGHADAR